MVDKTDDSLINDGTYMQLLQKVISYIKSPSVPMVKFRDLRKSKAFGGVTLNGYELPLEDGPLWVPEQAFIQAIKMSVNVADWNADPDQTAEGR